MSESRHTTGARAYRELERLSDVPLPSDVHRERRAEELSWVRRHGWAPALLSVRSEVEAALAAGVVVGPAMGSTEASLLLWCLGLTTFDPVVHCLAPSTFYKLTSDAPAAHARWYVSRSVSRQRRFQFDPLVAAAASRDAGVACSETEGLARLANRWCQIDPDHYEAAEPERKKWSFEHWPDPRWILAQGFSRGIDDLVSALALARPGPAGCGMLRAYLSADDLIDSGPFTGILRVSRGVLVFREQLHAFGRHTLRLDMDQTRVFARDICAGNCGPWEHQHGVVARRAGSTNQTEQIWNVIRAWSPHLFPLAHALGRARLVLRAAQLGVGFEDG